jgi:Protein of unknown function (DUF3105)
VKRQIFIAAAFTALLGLTACRSDFDSVSAGGESTTTTSSPIAGVQTYGPLPHTHVHGHVDDPYWQNCGVYDTPIQNENAVHSLEHGAVWLAYRPDLPADQVEVLRALARGHSHILVSPYPGLTEAVVATAWGVQLRLDSVDDPRLAQFVALYEQGPQAPEQGVTCSGALGDPIE